MINSFADKLIYLIKQNIPPGMLPVVFISEVLYIGKESAYRRLRGEIPFSFDEIIKVSKKLGVSLDEIADMDEWENKTNWVKYNLESLNFPLSDSYTELYLENIKNARDLFWEMEGANSMLRSAALFIPSYLLLQYEKLSLFRHYKAIYLTQKIDRDFIFSKMALPSACRELEKQVVESSQKMTKVLCVIDRNVFTRMVDDINYFFHEHLLSQKELLQLKAELLELLSYMETLAETGAFETGGQIDIYLSNVNIDSNYGHIENPAKGECAVNLTYFNDVIVYRNLRMCQKQRKWVELHKRFSTLITQTSEKERYDFFRKQRGIIENYVWG